jgi:hypothetical protein
MKLASDPKAQEMVRKAAAQAQQKASDPATRDKVDRAVADVTRRFTQR